MTASDFVVVERGEAPLLLSMPHVGTGLPGDFERRFVSPPLRWNILITSYLILALPPRSADMPVSVILAWPP